MSKYVEIDTTKKCLIRGYVVYADRQAGCVSVDLAKNPECLDVMIAYTPWHRHDDNLELLHNEIEKLISCYSSFNSCGGLMYGVEYHDYRR